MKSRTIQFNRLIQPVIGSFHGGIHPPEFKTISSETPSRTLALAAQLVVPAKQNLGAHGKIAVTLGQTVTAGQLLVDATNSADSSIKIAANIHSPVTGKIVDLSPRYLGHASGHPQAAICIETDLSTQDEPEVKLYPSLDWQQVAPAILLQRIQDAGIVGLGGATFPTHIKLGHPIHTLIVNAMECEPYITCDDRLLREASTQVLLGALITAKIVGAEKVIFAIEDNKVIAIESLALAINHTKTQIELQIRVAPTRYPSGGEKQTIELVTGHQLLAKTLPASIGILVQNVATLYAVFNAVVDGRPLTSRLVTVTGNQVAQPGNYWIPFGTRIDFIMQSLGIINFEQVIIGGPLMGRALYDFSVPVDKSTNCLIFNKKSEDDKTWLLTSSSHQECIRCGECAKVCPVELLPQQLYWFSQSEQWGKTQTQGLLDCIECGACAYVCPSEIPLVHYYRFAKSNLKQINQNNAIAEKAKQRFEFREARLVRAKAEKALKHKKAAEARKQAAMDAQQDPQGKQNAIQQALARVKQKKTNSDTNDSPTNTMGSK